MLGGAVDVVQGRQQPPDLLVAYPIEDDLGVPARRDQLLAPESGQVLRQRRLAQIHRLAELRYRQFAREGEPAKNEKALVVGDGPQNRADLAGLLFQSIDPVRQPHWDISALAIAKLVTANIYVNS